MKKQILLSIALICGLVFTTLQVNAETVTLYAGKAGGGYDAAMQRMSKTLSLQGIDAKVVNTSGSEEIVQQLCQGTGVGLAQADAVARAQLSGCQVSVLADYNKKGELVVYMYPPTGVKRFRDLTSGQAIATDLVGSGSDTTLRNIRQYGSEQKKAPRWASIEILNTEPLRAIAAAKQGKVAGLVLVRASLSDPTFQIFKDNGWSFGELWVEDLQKNFTMGSAPVYTEVKEKTPKDGNVWMYKLPAFYVAKGVNQKIEGIILNEAYR